MAFILQVSQGAVAGTGIALVGKEIVDCYQICVIVPHAPAVNVPPALWVMARRLFFSRVQPGW